jgi:general transcription factor 3C protein 4
MKLIMLGTAKLALSCSDGSVAILHICQTLKLRSGVVERKVEILKDEKMPDPDMRAINGTAWIEVSLSNGRQELS